MKYVGRGRIVLWEGASLWAFDVPTAPEIRRSTGYHSHHAIQMTLAVDGSFGFRIGDETGAQVVEGPAVVIAPDVSHAFDPVGRNAMIFIEPESRLGAAILRDLGGCRAARLDPTRFADIVATLSCIWQEPRPGDDALAGLGQALCSRLAATEMPARPINPRIARVIDKLDPERQMDVQEAAGIACLSESRFSHLFVAEIGLPFRTYLLWRRLIVAVDAMAAGDSLTTAAHQAGFADSAHFSRTFLRMFGVQASLLEMI